MDKLLLSLYFTVLLTLTVNSAAAPMPSSKIISAIEPQQQQQQPRPKKYNNNNNHHMIGNDRVQEEEEDDDLIKAENAESNVRMQKSNKITATAADKLNEYADDADHDDEDHHQRQNEFFRRDDLLNEMIRRQRQNKMIGYFAYNPYSAFSSPFTPQPVFYPPEFYDDFASFYGYGEDEEIMSRQNPGNRRRPQKNFQNSPIYYIRLPPTPYMFVPGFGYISQPPTYTPMAPPQPAISPFYNLPLDFISNGKPTNIYQWGSNPAINPQPQFVPQSAQPPQPSYQYPTRPQRPYQRPMNPYLQESKVTNLKGSFLFNGRPEEIFLLPSQSYNSIYSDPRFVSPYY
jgi:hypothetical protein